MSERTCVIIDDSAIIREALRMRFASCGFTVIGEARDGESGVQCIRELRPDVAMVDVRMPNGDGLWVLRQLTPDEVSRVLLLSAFADAIVVDQAMQLGAAGFALKDADIATLTGAVNTVHAKGSYIDPEIVSDILDASLCHFDAQQRLVLRLVASGLPLYAVAVEISVAMEEVEQVFASAIQQITGLDGITSRLHDTAMTGAHR